jgi:hypothetical protein
MWECLHLQQLNKSQLPMCTQRGGLNGGEKQRLTSQPFGEQDFALRAGMLPIFGS